MKVDAKFTFSTDLFEKLILWIKKASTNNHIPTIYYVAARSSQLTSHILSLTSTTKERIFVVRA